MSTELDHAREIAERIARRVSVDNTSQPNRAQPAPPVNIKPEVTSELAAVRAGLSELQRKIAQLEAKVSSESMDSPTDLSLSNNPYPVSDPARAAPLTHSPWLAGVNAGISHPSQEKFGVEEAVVSELVDYFEKEKICSVEPGGKPCDHCAMCRSRGF
jgi:hypothetical protein